MRCRAAAPRGPAWSRALSCIELRCGAGCPVNAALDSESEATMTFAVLKSNKQTTNAMR